MFMEYVVQGLPTVYILAAALLLSAIAGFSGSRLLAVDLDDDSI